MPPRAHDDVNRLVSDQLVDVIEVKVAYKRCITILTLVFLERTGASYATWSPVSSLTLKNRHDVTR